MQYVVFQKAKGHLSETAARSPYPNSMKGGRMQVVFGHTKTDMTACRMRHGYS